MSDGSDLSSRRLSPVDAVALASLSPRRYELLASLGIGVIVVATSYVEDDSAFANGDPRDLVLAHAEGKARLAQPVGPPLLVAADTAVVIDGLVLGKPRDPDEARSMLARLAGRDHVVHTGFVVADRSAGRSVSGVESARVTFLPLTEEQIARYVATGEPLDKAGAYGIQGRGALLVASIQGDFYTVMGLPLARLGRAFASLGYELL